MMLTQLWKSPALAGRKGTSPLVRFSAREMHLP